MTRVILVIIFFLAFIFEYDARKYYEEEYVSEMQDHLVTLRKLKHVYAQAEAMGETCVKYQEHYKNCKNGEANNISSEDSH